MDEEITVLDGVISVRMFDTITQAITNIVKHNRDKEGNKKYQNASHFVRCAIYQLIREELRHLGGKNNTFQK